MLYPRPKNVLLFDEVFRSNTRMKIYYTQKSEYVALKLSEITNLNLVEIKYETECVLVSDEFKPIRLQCPQIKGAYNLEINADFIQITANDYDGIFYGLMTIQQLKTEDGYRLSRITDYPDVKMRGIHLDLKGAMPTAEYLKRIIEELAKTKINTILLEYEDKFPFEKYSFLRAESALAKDELTEILELARNSAITVIPLLQCLGHSDYIFRKTEFSDLAEGDKKSMYCPSNDKAFELFCELAKEVMAYHPDTEYFHIGGDEARFLGHCEKCKGKSPKDLINDHLRKVIGFVKESGYKSILWDDMLYKENAFNIFTDISENVALNLWEYDAIKSKTSYIRWGENAYVSNRWIMNNPEYIVNYGCWIENLDNETQEMIKKYKRLDENMLGEPFAWKDNYKENGYEVIGAAGIRGAGSWRAFNSYFPDFSERFANVSIWAKAAAEDNLTGVIATAWSRFENVAPPTECMDVSLYGFIGVGGLFWDQTYENIEQIASEYMFGIDISKALLYIEEGRKKNKIVYYEAAIDLLKTAQPKKNNELIKLYITIAEILKLQFDIEFNLMLWEPLIYYKNQNDLWRSLLKDENRKKAGDFLVKVTQMETAMIDLHSSTMSIRETKEYVLTKTLTLRLRLQHLIDEWA